MHFEKEPFDLLRQATYFVLCFGQAKCWKEKEKSILFCVSGKQSVGKRKRNLFLDRKPHKACAQTWISLLLADAGYAAS